MTLVSCTLALMHGIYCYVLPRVTPCMPDSDHAKEHR